MNLSTRIILMIIFLIGFVITLVLINIFTKIPECPATLPPEYYACSNDFDCTFNPVFECINSNKDYYCEAPESLITARQEVSNRIQCRCYEGKCNSYFIQ